ncbi:sensor histidine kinase [Geoalkalibacter sp.]|uniref:sensor histidine kinase n=1 Tax=Geoalkalibacter sp. TaxID=3041440 RepID=UPI00272E2053|nr:PAS domain-containing sensor histidine kinase [Geoalkalibacter sp.]
MNRARKQDPLGLLGLDNRFARSLVETAQIIILVLDAEGRVVYFNPYTERLLGWSLAEAAGRSWVETFVPVAERERIGRLLRDVVAGEPQRGNVNGVLTRDGRSLPVEWHDDKFFDETGRLVGLLSIGCDVSERLACERVLNEHQARLEAQVAARTAELRAANRDLRREVAERRRAEKELAQTSLQLEAILDAIPDVIGVVTPELRVVRFNRAGYEFFGKEPRELIGRHCYGLNEREEPCEFCPVGEVLRTRRPGRKEVYDPVRKAWFDVRVYPVFDRRKRIRYLIEHLRDVSRQRQIDRLKSEFISTAAHELRTPLAAVTGFSELLLARGDLSPAEQREFLSYIHDKSWALTRIVENLLEISRAESGKKPALNPFPCRVGDLVRQAEPLLKQAAPLHAYHIELEEEDLELIVDRQRIAQVLDNLLSNACKYSPGGGMIRVAGRKRDRDYLLSVSDEGIGMTAEEVERVFDKFYRADGSNTAVAGIGLGMSMARTLVEAHGGRIWVKSSPGQGTTVYFTLPLEYPGLASAP